MFSEPQYAVVITKVITAFSVTVSCPLYLLVLFVIYTNRNKAPFNSTFFTIFVTLGIFEVAVYFMFSVRKLPYWRFELSFFKPYNEPNTVMAILSFFIWWFGYIQLQLSILICLNRFVSIVLRKGYRKYWTIRATKIAIFLILFNTMWMSLPILFTGVTVAKYTSTDDGITTFQIGGPTFINPQTAKAYMLTWKIHVYTILAVCTLCYVIMFIKVKEIRVLLKQSAMRREFRLLYPMTVLYVCNFLYIGYFVLTDYWVNTDHPFSRNSEWTIYVAADAYDLNNAYVIMLTSKEVREAVFQFMGLRFKKKNEISLPVSSNLSQRKPFYRRSYIV